MIIRESTLAHMNPYHDPETGQFTTKAGGTVTLRRSDEPSPQLSEKQKKKANKYVRRLIDYADSSKNAYEYALNDAANAVIFGSKSKAREAARDYEFAEMYKDHAAYYAKKLDKMGVKIGGNYQDVLNDYHYKIGEAFIKQSMAKRLGKSLVSFGFANTDKYMLDKNKLLTMINNNAE